MAKLHDVVTCGIALSQEFSEKYNDKLYTRIADSFPLNQISIQALGEIIVDYLKQNSSIKKITMREFPNFTNGNVNGMLRIKDDEVLIYVNSKMNECWKRFTYCKELLQLYIDFSELYKGDDNYSTSDIIKQLTELVETQSQSVPNDGGVFTKASWEPFTDEVFTELTAIVMATDLVFDLNNDSSIIDQLFIFSDNNDIKTYDIAHAYKMPEYIVKFYKNNFYKFSKEMLESKKKIAAIELKS